MKYKISYALVITPLISFCAFSGVVAGDGKPTDGKVFDDPAYFLEDIGPITPTTTLQTYSGECTSIDSCGDYFDVSLGAGARLLLSFCVEEGGAADFDTGLGVWDASDIPAGTIATDDDGCPGPGLESQLTFRPTNGGTYRVLIGTFGTTVGGTYTLAYQLISEPMSIRTDSSVTVGGPFLRIPSRSNTPPASECINWQDDEGKLTYDYINNMLWVCAPDSGGWNQINLTLPPAP